MDVLWRMIGSQRFAWVWTLASVAVTLAVVSPIADSIHPSWREERASYGGTEAHPLLRRFLSEPVLRDMDLRHAASGRFQRRPESLWHMKALRPRREKLDVLFVGDSTVAWAIDPQTVGEQSGLSVGHLAFEGNKLGQADVALLPWLASCLLKPDGLLIAGYAWHGIVFRRGENQGWNAQEKAWIEALKGHDPKSDCEWFSSYVRQKGGWLEPPPAYTFQGYVDRRDEIEQRIIRALPVESPYLSLRQIWHGKAPTSGNEEGGVGSFFWHGDDVITRVNDYGDKIDATLRNRWAEDVPPSEQDRAKLTKAFATLESFAQSRRFCWLTMVADADNQQRQQETGKLAVARRELVPSACLLDVAQLLVEHVGVAQVRLQGTIHPAETTGQLISIALGRELQKNPALKTTRGVMGAGDLPE